MRVLICQFLDGGSSAKARRRLMRTRGRCVCLTGLLMGVGMACIGVQVLAYFQFIFWGKLSRLGKDLFKAYKAALEFLVQEDGGVLIIKLAAL